MSGVALCKERAEGVPMSGVALCKERAEGVPSLYEGFHCMKKKVMVVTRL